MTTVSESPRTADIRLVRSIVSDWRAAHRASDRAANMHLRSTTADGITDEDAEVESVEMATRARADIEASVRAISSWTRPEHASILDDARVPDDLRTAAAVAWANR